MLKGILHIYSFGKLCWPPPPPTLIQDKLEFTPYVP